MTVDLNRYFQAWLRWAAVCIPCVREI